MHPDDRSDEENKLSESNVCLQYLTIQHDWLTNTKWNSDICFSLKTKIESDLNHLNKIRITTAFNNNETKNQIRILENNLVINLSKLILARRKFDKWNKIDDLQNYSLLNDWLLAIGLDCKCKEILLGQYDDIEEILNADEEELKILLWRGFNLKFDGFDINNFDDELKSPESYSSENDCGSRNGIEDIEIEASIVQEQDLTNYVRDYIKRVLKAQRSMHKCVQALKNFSELTSRDELFWDSWNHWIDQADESKKAILAAAIATASKKTKHSPKPLPPLPDLKTNFLKNFSKTNANGTESFNNSRSTGSSPLSPPIPPLSAGNFSHRSTSSSSSSSMIHNINNLNIIVDPNHVPNYSTRKATPPPTPPVSHHKKSFILSSASIFAISSNNNSNSNRNSDRKFPTTPPPIRRHQTNIFGGENFPLTKSKSHEEHLSNRIEPLDPVINSKLLKKYNLVSLTSKSSKNKHNSLDNLPHVPHHQRRRLATEPGSIGSTSPILTSSNCSSPIAVSPETYGDIKQSIVTSTNSTAIDNCFLDSVPRSPRSQAMSHSIHHRFVSTMKINSIQCNVCEKQMFFGFKCRDCKYYCHRDCQDKAPNSCGLPTELVDIFKQTLSEGQTRSSSPKNLPQRAKSQLNYYSSQMNSSHSSSNPSSPALFNHSSSSSTTISPTTTGTFKIPGNSQFQFPPDINITSTLSIDYGADLSTEQIPYTSIEDIDEMKQSIPTIEEEEEIITATSSINSTAQTIQKPLVDSEKSSNSALITSGSSGDSVRTVTGRLDSQDSQASDVDQNERPWPRQNSVTSKEWDIPYDELKIEEKIGMGRFGTVFRGKWHGSVAIKRLNITNVDEERKAFDSFKQEVAIFRKTRHDNLVLFMGACMKPPHLAIVTSFCKGLTLHTHIHVRHDKFNLNRTIMIAEQICLGMGYLHARQIIHKDLKTKNIFYENGKVIITDFGLSSVAKLCVSNRRGDWLTVPKGWLCYLAPEIIRVLSVNSQESDDLPFSVYTDVYAFGTVWFELLFGIWPFIGQPPEIVIWQVGKGYKQPIINFQTSKEIKDLLYTCWDFIPEKRPDFGKLYDYLEKLPKKRLQRSPSHPAHLQHVSEMQTFF